MKKTLLLLFLLTFLFGMAPKDISIIDGLRETLKIVTDERDSLKTENKKLKVENTLFREQDKDNKLALEPMRFFRERNDIDYNNPYQFDVDHYKYLLKCIDKYEYLLTPESRESAKRDNIHVRNFMIAWPAKESHYNKFARHMCDDGTVDVTLYQLNKGPNSVCWKDLYSRLPEELKKVKDPENNVDVGVAMMYLWINDRVKLKWSWAFLSYKSDKGKIQDWAWTLYWRLGQI